MSKIEYQNHTCPVCKGTKHIVLFKDHNRRDNISCSGTYVQCRECTLVFLRDRQPWEEIVKFYSAMDEGLTANAGLVGAQQLRQQIEKRVPTWKQITRKIRFRPHSWPLESVLQGSKRLLDVGCGNGAKLFEFAKRGYEVWGVDVGEDAIRLCRELLPQGNFRQGELPEIGLPDNYFDYIRIDNTLEHVPNPKEMIAECHRLLHKGGQLMIYVPHGRSLSMRLMKGNSISAWIPFHLQLFTPKSLRRLLEDAGFNPQKKQSDPIRIYEYPPTSWLPASIMQWKNRNRANAEYAHSRWLTLACYPIGWLAAKFGIGEELVGIGKV